VNKFTSMVAAFIVMFNLNCLGAAAYVSPTDELAALATKLDVEKQELTRRVFELEKDGV
jgi:hypothetical protein